MTTRPYPLIATIAASVALVAALFLVAWHVLDTTSNATHVEWKGRSCVVVHDTGDLGPRDGLYCEVSP